MKTVYLEPSQVPPALRSNYSGKQFRAQVCEQVTIPCDAGLWSGGSRDHYSAMDISTGRQLPIPGQSAAPWDATRRDIPVTIKPGFAIVRHTVSQGKDLGITFFLHPENAAAMLPAPIELTPHEKIVLSATAQYKASYNGQDRYQMAIPYNRALLEQYPTREQWEAAKQSLIARGFLNKAGAITVKGRNAI